jgi:imidazolonepropionase-like amidohydrolase
MTRSAAACLLALVAAGCGSPPPPPGDVLVLRNFTLIDGTDRPPVPGAAMIVSEGRVSWVGPAADLDAPAGAPATDLAGAFVIPGLVNLHGHLGNTVDLTQDSTFHTQASIEKDLRTLASYGVTTVLSMGTDQDVVFAVRDAQRAGRPSMARVYTAGQGLVFTGGYGGLTGVNTPVATPAEAEAAVVVQLDKQVDVIKIWLDSELGTMPKMPPAMTQAIIEASHRRDVPVVAHVFYLEDAKRLVDQGIDGLVHSVRDLPVDQALIDSMTQHGTWQAAATLSREASMFAYGSTPAFASDPFFTRGISATALDLLRSPERQKTVAAGANFPKYPAFFDTAKANLKRLADAGIPIGFGTDTGPPGRFPGPFEHWELQLMADAGLTPAQVLQAATGRSAAFLRATDLGTLEPAKWADFVVIDADPLADIRNTRTIRSVYIAGTEVPR